jgi:hypothetical protein
MTDSSAETDFQSATYRPRDSDNATLFGDVGARISLLPVGIEDGTTLRLR